MKNKTEKCVICKCDTGVDVGSQIDSRLYYIEGAGQLCASCYNSIYKHINK